jgi:ribonuclease HI
MIPQTEPASAEYPVIAYGDGSALQNNAANPGPAGHAWCAKVPGGILIDYQRHDPAGTNSTQEMKALRSFLEWQHPDQPATLYLDSKFVVDACNGGLAKWKANSWRLASGAAPANLELWKEIDALLTARKITVLWTKAHADSRGNVRADKLAGEAARDGGLTEGRVRQVKTW